MPAKLVSITIDEQSQSIKPGATRGQDLFNKTNIALHEQLLLEVQGDIDVPIAAHDLIFLRGGESFSIGDGTPQVSDNPRLRSPISFLLNNTSVSSEHAKITGANLKSLAEGLGFDLWADLDGIADEILEDQDNIVLQPVDKFFTVPSEEDRFYEVTVILDGEDHQYRFPAAMTVREATRRSLSPADRPKVDEFDMVDGNLGTSPLTPDQTLKAAGVRDGHVLSITKKNGGGG
jgi:hypothetical protein